MRLTLRLLLIVALLAAAALTAGGLATPQDAAATHGRQCGVIAKGSADFLVLGKKVKCGKARKGARRYLKKRKSLRGFKCRKNVGQYKFVCKHKKRRGKSYRAQRL